MASNIDIQKKCEWCGKLFIANKTTTRCCSHRCANHAYKERTRQKRVSEFQTMVNQQIEKEDCIDKDFFTLFTLILDISKIIMALYILYLQLFLLF